MTQVSDTKQSIRRESLRQEIARQEQQPKTTASKVAGAKGSVDGMEHGVPVKAASQVLVLSPVTDDKGQAGANLFAGLSRSQGENPPARRLGMGVGMDKDTSPSASTLAKLGKLEQALLAQDSRLQSRGLAATDKIRQGVMLCLSDAVAKHTDAKTKVPRGLVASISESLAESGGLERVKAAMKNNLFGARGSFPMGMDVNAFVQAVLRESYLLQNEILKDFADEVRRLNELRKEIRAKVQKVRQWKQAIANGEDPGDLDFGLFLSDDDFKVVWEDDPAGSTGASDDSGDRSESTDAHQGDLTDPQVILLPDSLASRFAPYSACSESDLIDVEGLLGKLSKGDAEDKADAFKSWCVTYRGGDSSNKIKTARELLVRVVPELSVEDLKAIISCASKFMDGYRYDGGKKDCDWTKWYGTEMMAAVVNAATPAQLQELLGELTGKKKERVIDAMNGASIAVLDAYPNVQRALDWPEDSSLAPLKDLYAQYLSLPAADPRRAAIRVKMRAVMWEKTPEQVRGVFEAMLTHDPKADEQIVYMMLLGCDGEKVFAESNPEQWAFLGEAGPSLQKFLEKWASATSSGESSGQAVPGCDLQVEKCQQDFSDELANNQANPNTLNSQPQSRSADLLKGAGEGEDVDSSSNSLNDSNAGGEDRAGAGRLPTEKSLDEYIEALQSELETAGGDAQLANVDLQNALQQQQQTLQMMSNISKMLHDTAMSIIRKIGS